MSTKSKFNIFLSFSAMCKSKLRVARQVIPIWRINCFIWRIYPENKDCNQRIVNALLKVIFDNEEWSMWVEKKARSTRTLEEKQVQKVRKEKKTEYERKLQQIWRSLDESEYKFDLS